MADLSNPVSLTILNNMLWIPDQVRDDGRVDPGFISG